MRTLLPVFTTHWHVDLQTRQRGLSCLCWSRTTCKNALNSLFAWNFSNTNNSESEMENFSRWSQSATAHVHILTQACKTSHMLIFTGLSGGLPLRNSIRETSCVYSSIKSLRKLIRGQEKHVSFISAVGWFLQIPDLPTRCFFQSLICRHHFNPRPSRNELSPVKLILFYHPSPPSALH